ncbi:MAG: hypothetical protein GX601_10780 [Anaerolineales bacterium]|nr:hypothetical protein [Anaerolineales bacterium]
MWKTQAVEGRPVPVGDRELVPIVNVATYVERRVLVGAHRLAGEGHSTTLMRPVGVVERSATGTRTLPVVDRARWTRTLMWLLILVGSLAALAAAVLGHQRSGDNRRRPDGH